jgi:peptidoglycan/LPS O-acetylase OafA/YrhL
MTIVLYHYFSLNTLSSADDKSLAQLDPVSRAVGVYLHALGNGYLAVGFFFMLSGFVLAHAHFKQLADGTFEYAHFLKRRFSRIYPLHFLVTVAYGSLYLLTLRLGIAINNPENFTWSAFFSNVFLLRGLNLIGRLTFNGPAWYVSSQWHLYLLFPLLGLCVLRSPFKSIPTLFAAILFFLAMFIGLSGDNLLTQRTYDFGILRAIAEFPIGLALYQVFCDYQKSGSKMIRPIHLAGMGLVVILAAQLDVDDSLIILLLAGFILVCAATNLRYELKWLTHPWFIYAGEISFAIYLIHVPFLACARKALPILGVSSGSLAEGIFLIACALVLVPTAAFVHSWIERPASEWTWNMLNRPRKRFLSPA